ncbi:AGAP000947-PA-like protein [Anopheles sinensis]|uniref:glutathione transferase n=1 Tax=Anopheles sinensis TaxID=74873 RepID=A0A084WF84_ANOSI|nr:AGAP000947-PA-like protein [Anopheles sinensis]
MKLYAVSDGPPSLSVRMALEALNISYELVNVDYGKAEHLTEDYAKYLCDKYAPDSELYPKEPKQRALVNHRLCFNLSFFYPQISAYVMAPIFFDYQRTDIGLKKLTLALEAFETYLKKSGSTYVAGDSLTIADFPLVASVMCLEAIEFDVSGKYPTVFKWYSGFKTAYPKLWAIAAKGMEEIAEFEKNPPDLTGMVHPIHPIRKVASK